MSKSVKVVLGIATIWPLAYFFVFISFWFYLLLHTTSKPQVGEGPPLEIVAIFILHGITMLWIFALLAIYIYNVFNNERVGKDKKALWAVVLFMGNAFAMPIYWYLYIWCEDNRQARQPSRPGSTEE